MVGLASLLVMGLAALSYAIVTRSVTPPLPS
jgi:hypothetical protein